MSPFVPRQAQNQADLDAGVTHYLNVYDSSGMGLAGSHVKLTAPQSDALEQLLAAQPQGAEDPFVATVTDAKTGATVEHVSHNQVVALVHLLASMPHLAVHPLPIALHSGALLAGGATLQPTAKLSAGWKLGLGAAAAAGLAFFL